MSELSREGKVRWLLGLFEGRVKRLNRLVKICAPGDLIGKEIQLINNTWKEIAEEERRIWLSWDNSTCYFGEDLPEPTRMSRLPQFLSR